jgi:hypothetical protein
VIGDTGYWILNLKNSIAKKFNFHSKTKRPTIENSIVGLLISESDSVSDSVSVSVSNYFGNQFL